MTGPVVRRWEARVARADLDGRVETDRNRVLPRVRTVDGFRSAALHAARDGDPCRVAVLTVWQDMDAVRRFAGEDPARTALPDVMTPVFPEYDERATFHDELLSETRA